jgi:hypothetical protein
MSDAVTLEFVAAQQRQLLDEMSLFRAKFAVVHDEIRVLSAMAMRQDTTSKAVLDQLERGSEETRRLNQEMRRFFSEEIQRVTGGIQRVNERLASIEARIQ